MNTLIANILYEVIELDKFYIKICFVWLNQSKNTLNMYNINYFMLDLYDFFSSDIY